MEEICTYYIQELGIDVTLYEQDMKFLAFAKAHRQSWFRQFERLQRRDAKKAEKAMTIPNEV